MTISEKEAAVMRAVARLHLQRVKRMAEGQKMPTTSGEERVTRFKDVPEDERPSSDNPYYDVLSGAIDVRELCDDVEEAKRIERAAKLLLEFIENAVDAGVIMLY